MAARPSRRGDRRRPGGRPDHDARPAGDFERRHGEVSRGSRSTPARSEQELGVDAVVDGGVRVVGDRLRISARLVDVATGERLLVYRYEGRPGGGPRTRGDHGPARRARAPAPGARATRRAPQCAGGGPRALPRRRDRERGARGGDHSRGEPPSLGWIFSNGRSRSRPTSGLALAAHADRSVRRWFLPTGQNDEDEPWRGRRTSRSTRACTLAPQLPLTHFAAGRLAVSDEPVSRTPPASSP